MAMESKQELQRRLALAVLKPLTTAYAAMEPLKKEGYDWVEKELVDSEYDQYQSAIAEIVDQISENYDIDLENLGWS